MNLKLLCSISNSADCVHFQPAFGRPYYSLECNCRAYKAFYRGCGASPYEEPLCKFNQKFMKVTVFKCSYITIEVGQFQLMGLSKCETFFISVLAILVYPLHYGSYDILRRVDVYRIFMMLLGLYNFLRCVNLVIAGSSDRRYY